MKSALARILLFALAFAVAPAAADDSRTPTPDPWFSTFSIIAFDPATKEFGVGVQSRAFAAGAAVPYAKPGVGAVATQAAANRLYGPKAIALLEQGLSPAEVVKKITDEDAGREPSQTIREDLRRVKQLLETGEISRAYRGQEQGGCR